MKQEAVLARACLRDRDAGLQRNQRRPTLHLVCFTPFLLSPVHPDRIRQVLLASTRVAAGVASLEASCKH